jgi:DNA-binding protein YbaB
MFDKVREYNRLKKVQGGITKQIEQIFVTAEKADIRVVIRGDKRIEKLEIDGVDNKMLRDLINESFKEVDKKVEKQTRGQLQNLGFPGT